MGHEQKSAKTFDSYLEEIWGAKKISLYGRERHPVRQITDLRQSAYFVRGCLIPVLLCPVLCVRASCFLSVPPSA